MLAVSVSPVERCDNFACGLILIDDIRDAQRRSSISWKGKTAAVVRRLLREMIDFLTKGGGAVNMNISERTEMLVPEPACALAGLLGVPVPDLVHGGGLPLLWHWVYLLDRPAQSDLGADGAPKRGTVTAFSGQGRRRLWAGGRVRTGGPLKCGEPATKRSRVLSRQEKEGRSGPLTFITVGHQILQHGRVVIDEQQDIVYREAVSPAEPAPILQAGGPVVQLADGERSIDVSSTLLFRFSALTYNAHRVHYDRDYGRDVEGLPGLLTQGPLQALAMAEAARAAGCHDGPVDFEYRLIEPLFDFQGMVVGTARDQDATVTVIRDLYGRQTAAGRLMNASGRRHLHSAGLPRGWQAVHLVEKFDDRRVNLVWAFQVADMTAGTDLKVIAVRYGLRYLRDEVRRAHEVV